MTYTRRQFLGTTALAVAGAGLSACTGVSDEPSGGGSGNQGSNTLRLFTYDDASQMPKLKEQIAAFDQQNGTTTTVDNLPGSGAAVYPDKLRTQLLGGSGPDVWRIWGGQLGAPFATAKQAADLAPYYAKYGWDGRINQNAIAGMTFDGVKSGVPFFLAGVGAWYNKALFAKAKVQPPTSYAALEQLNDALVAAGVTPLGTGGKYGWHIMRLFEFLLEVSAGPELHDKLLAGAETWDRPEVVTAFTNFKKWQDRKWMPQGALGLDPADIEPGFVQGKQAYTIAGQWVENNAIGAAKKPASEFGTFELPTDHTPTRHSGFVEGYMVNARSANKDKAAALIDFLVQPATQKALGITGSTVTGAEPDQAKLPLAAQWTDINKSSPFYTIQDQAFPKQQSDQYFTVQSELLQGKASPAEAAKKMQDVVSAWAKDK
ncbi:extracellular solute-binding protein [Asanoa sp. NPDC050611]|uniref:ABC transporter substrate-binding protein n=1 Tax=Asanoa sp. NPDC050611 TaxID=3157098 RepID=UPI0033D7072C